MGGEGSGRLTKENSIVRSMTYNPFIKSKPEALIIPDKSGDHSSSIRLAAPIKDEDVVNKKYVDDSCSNVIPIVNVLPAVEVGKVVYYTVEKHLYLGID